MQARIPKSAALAALLALSAPLLVQAHDDATDLPAVTTALSPLPKSPALDVSSVKPAKPAKMVDEEAFREKDVWGRIRSGYAIPDVNNDLVAKHVNWYATRPDYIARTTARASLYLFHVVSELEKRNMPTELALLPFIESAFNPQALSSANAAGIWQFVPGTGRDFNLKQDAFKDERRGILASTDGKANTRAQRRMSATSLRAPGSQTASCSRCAATSPRSVASSGPLPMTASLSRGASCGNCARSAMNAVSSVVWSLSGRTRPTLTMTMSSGA